MNRRGNRRSPLVLVTDHEEWPARSIESILASSGYDVKRATSAQKALEYARSARPDLIILDADLPDGSGIEACRSLRKDPAVGAHTPILIITTGPDSRRQRLQALAAGAWDVLPLPIDTEELVLRLAVFLQAKLEANRSRDRALLDPITGLYNARGLRRRLSELGSLAHRYGRAVSCLALSPTFDGEPGLSLTSSSDNETSLAVDRLTRVLKTAGRVSDAIGRLRGAVFAVIAPDTDLAGARTFAGRLLQTAESVEAEGVEVDPLRLNVGLYATSNIRAEGIAIDDILGRALQALERFENSADLRIRSWNSE